MTIEIPQYGLKAYALLFSKHGVKGEFKQSELDWIVSASMKKKIFSVLLRSGWLIKKHRSRYSCMNPSEAIIGLLEFRVPEVMKASTKKYSFTQASAVEIWSDFSYVQRSKEKSPYFIKILKKDLRYWKEFFNAKGVSNYVGPGAAIGEYVILISTNKIQSEDKNGFKVDSLNETMTFAKGNDIFDYATNYMKKKYGKTI